MKSYKIRNMVLGVILMSAPLLASQEEQQHIPVGERAMSHVDRVRIQEQRAEREQKLENGEPIEEGEEEVLEQVDPERLVRKGFDAKVYYTTHEGAFHHPFAVSLFGDTVELEDGSIWAVSSGDKHKTLDWLTGDVIIIAPNHTWFSVYDYCLINLNTGAHVKVNLSLGPIYNGIYTHWILAIDYSNREICLEDGSIWKISSWDSSVMKKWWPNDTVIIGINDGWFSGSNPNILINVNMNNYATGKCLN